MKTNEFLKIFTLGGAVIGTSIAIKMLVGFVTQIVFARILAPEVFGEMAFVVTVAMFFDGFVNLRGDTYFVQSKDDNKNVLSVIFTSELVLATFVFLLVYFIAPIIMTAFAREKMTGYVQLLALAYFYNPFVLPKSYFEKKMQFKNARIPFVLSQIISSAVSITIALNGFGIWSLYWWRILSLLNEAILVWVLVPVRPRLHWDFKIFKKFISFSWPLTLSGVLSFFCYNIDYFIVRQYSPSGSAGLGYYWLGFQAAAYLLIIRKIINDVLIPVFANIDSDAFKHLIFSRLSRAVGAVFLFLAIVIIMFSKELIVGIYGSKWEPAVIPFQIIMIVIMTRAINSNSGYYLYSYGKTRVDLLSTLTYGILLVPAAYFGTVKFGINGTAFSVLIIQIVICLIFYSIYIKPLTGLNPGYFFYVPWALAGVTCFCAILFDKYQVHFAFKIATAVALLCVAYVTFGKQVVFDIVRTNKIMVNKNAA